MRGILGTAAVVALATTFTGLWTMTPIPAAAVLPVAAPPIVTVDESPVGFATCDLRRETDDARFCLLGQQNAAGDFVLDWSYVTTEVPPASLTGRVDGRAVVANLPSVTDAGFVKVLHWESTIPGLGPIVVDVAPFYGDEDPSSSDSNIVCSGDFQTPGVPPGQRLLSSRDAVIYVANVSATIDGARVESYRDNCSAFWFGPTSGVAVLQPGG
ncbi:MAG TPA: hypothetical protein VNB24_07475 [Acidimicrobiales bacterium]|nr:hypothetical protein [Acidimicrobiales bacterium]